MTAPKPSQSLWDFALAFYAQPLMADACLQLQDEYQANVCLLIGLRWLDMRGQHLDDAEFAAVKNHIQGWSKNVIEPLRSLRRELKLPFENWVQDETQMQLRAAIKQAELLAEKKLLIEFERWVVARPTQHVRAANNLERYLMQLAAPKNLIELMRSDLSVK